VSNARVASAAEAFVRRKIADLLTDLPDPGDHTPPRVPHPPRDKRHGRPRRRQKRAGGGGAAGHEQGKDRKYVDDKDRDGKRRTSDEDDDVGELLAQSTMALQPRDSLILSRERISRSRVS